MMIPSITVHLQALNHREEDPNFHKSTHAMHYATAMIPVAPMILPGVWDIKDLLVLLKDNIRRLHAKSSRDKEIEKSGEMTFATTQHKCFEYEVGGLEFVLAACAEDRPAQVIRFKPTDENSKDFEMLHMYHAMGLSRQHHMQQIILARGRDFQLAQAVVAAAQEILEQTGRVTVTPVNKDKDLNDKLKESWYKTAVEQDTSQSTSRLSNSIETDALTLAADAREFSECASFLDALFVDDPYALSLVEAVAHIQSAEMHYNASVRTPKPRMTAQGSEVNYTHECPNCKSPPGEIILSKHFAGRLLWGGFSPVLSLAWLKRQGVTHVLNCIGAKKGDGSPEPSFGCATRNRYRTPPSYLKTFALFIL
jgi:hypothetical protein